MKEICALCALICRICAEECSKHDHAEYVQRIVVNVQNPAKIWLDKLK